VPIIAFFMDPSPIEDPALIGEASVFMKTLKIKTVAPERFKRRKIP
jgi:hypothetical protein